MSNSHHSNLSAEERERLEATVMQAESALLSMNYSEVLMAFSLTGIMLKVCNERGYVRESEQLLPLYSNLIDRLELIVTFSDRLARVMAAPDNTHARRNLDAAAELLFQIPPQADEAARAEAQAGVAAWQLSIQVLLGASGDSVRVGIAPGTLRRLRSRLGMLFESMRVESPAIVSESSPGIRNLDGTIAEVDASREELRQQVLGAAPDEGDEAAALTFVLASIIDQARHRRRQLIAEAVRKTLHCCSLFGKVLNDEPEAFARLRDALQVLRPIPPEADDETKRQIEQEPSTWLTAAQLLATPPNAQGGAPQSSATIDANLLQQYADAVRALLTALEGLELPDSPQAADVRKAVHLARVLNARTDGLDADPVSPLANRSAQMRALRHVLELVAWAAEERLNML
jgi:hypothetical protein